MGPFSGTVERRILAVLSVHEADEPVIALHGPRSVGKSTLLRSYAQTRGVAVIDLDDPEVLDAVIANPTLAVNGPTPVCIDEYQKAPDLLDALKARLNREGARPGTAVLTGSTRHDAIPRTAQALTGRLHVLTILPLSQAEIAGQREDLLERLIVDPEEVVGTLSRSTTDRTEYVRRVCAGGFPLALRRSGPARVRWFDDYVRSSVERDAVELARVRQRKVLGELLERLAGQTAQILNVAVASRGLDADRKTIDGYVRLLEDLFLVQTLPAWGTTLRARAVKHPKIHTVDSGLAARLLRCSETKLATLEPSALSEFGHLLETFVHAELRKQASWLEEPLSFGHWKADDDEIDIVVELDDGRILGIEVKANQRISAADLNGFRKLRSAIGTRFVAGIAFSTGSRSYTVEDRLHVLPIDRLWRSTTR